ncbi:T9SS type B sorting domain-containing protein [Flavobacterium sp.]|uniref:T9SS type B sorting domain-containing protein n=1 Tax=Flavobacterium sp. TaxID=239 RepID=UPI002B4B6095|nr:T9SS type B sorting domain-containing protein [Flavobacterium sp.]HLF52821.1 T9SS type B sorting domain-containing protein [Flavobacterium sp.]
MGKFTKLFVFVFLITIFSTLRSYSQNFINNDDFENGNAPNATLLAPCDPPVVTSPLYLCQNSTATPIIVTPSTGGILTWYGTNATGGTASAIPPTPSTTTVGSTTYYVSQTIGGCESSRVPIVVNVVADNGAVILNLRCDPSQILPPDVGTSVFFDWSNNPLISNTYNYSYTVQGGAAVTGSVGVSHLQVFGLLPGQSVTLTLTSATSPCVPPQTITCTVPCGTSTITPNFPAIPAFCSGTVAPILATTSPNGIVGTWSPAVVSNTVSGSYVFTPNLTLKPCATNQTLSVTVSPRVSPTFTAIPGSICQNATAPSLPTSSTNSPSITGTWNPAVINTATLGTTVYTFIPNPGQCVTATPTTVSITIVSVVTPNFANIPALCSGTTAPLLLNTSPNGITGTWSPATISNTTSRSYVFTPNPNQCATTQTLNVTIIPRIVPDFQAIPSFCTGTTPPLLGATSPNGISGNWSPPIINNTASGTYIFTPDASQCATTQILNVTVNPLTLPDFDNISICLGGPIPSLNNTSPNGITGTWSPPIIDGTTNGSYVFTPNINECASSQTIDVTVNQATLLSFEWSVSEAFAENQIITVAASPPGNYLYQLDFGPLQTNPVFENVALGTHTLTVYDANGCAPPITRDNILVINYPTFFTPNGDGYNETWNIFELSDQSNSKIFIFDRYGKLLKEISPRGLGWDGTYIGHPMPSTDYWFYVEYTEQSISKKFKAHFSLKR